MHHSHVTPFTEYEEANSFQDGSGLQLLQQLEIAHHALSRDRLQLDVTSTELQLGVATLDFSDFLEFVEWEDYPIDGAVKK